MGAAESAPPARPLAIDDAALGPGYRLVLIDGESTAVGVSVSMASIMLATPAGRIAVMSLGSIHDSRADDGSVAAAVALGILWIAWHAVRIPLLALLLILEPVVTLVLWGAALLGVMTAFLFEFSGVVPDFPFALIISISIGCAVLVMAYHVLLNLLS